MKIKLSNVIVSILISVFWLGVARADPPLDPCDPYYEDLCVQNGGTWYGGGDCYCLSELPTPLPAGSPSPAPSENPITSDFLYPDVGTILTGDNVPVGGRTTSGIPLKALPASFSMSLGGGELVVNPNDEINATTGNDPACVQYDISTDNPPLYGFAYVVGHELHYLPSSAGIHQFGYFVGLNPSSGCGDRFFDGLVENLITVTVEE